MRLPTHNLQILNAPFLQHQLPLHLNNLALLEPIFDNMIQDQLSLMPFNKLIRSRRELSHYYDVLSKAPRVTNSRKFTEIVQRFKREKQLI